ncbi:immunoglobulin-binding protein 1 [Schistocerca nitens]|uniref:immunoglobulin-binding protein 1 n=1 Tax=Schistocerca nitens TaxID=7011 RepID=UPI00211968C2|nr:immunoglobulin-binding protein 1 [Schistocerca nitens]
MANTDDHEMRQVSEMFDEGLQIYKKLDKIDEPTNSSSVQSLIKKAMHILEDATRLISLAGVFSSNEALEEIATNDIKYLLLPALLGGLALKLCVDDRLEVINTAEVYFRDFLTRCKDYGVIDIEVPQPSQQDDDKVVSPVGPQSSNLIDMAIKRNTKLQRYKEHKELEKKLELLGKEMEESNVDEEVKRNFYITLIKCFANQAVDELNNIEMEKPLIAHMAQVRKGAALGIEEEKSRKVRPPQKPLKPIIITKDEVQKKVFGAGYPSLPVMTVEEFYEKRVKDGDFPDPTQAKALSLQDMAARENANELAEQEEMKKELATEKDEEEALRRAREWDEFKDEHRRGWGNRMNRS